MKESSLFGLLALFTLALVSWSYLEYSLSTNDSDCGYTAAEACTQFANYEQQVLLWRAFALELAAILAFVLLRKR